MNCIPPLAGINITIRPEIKRLPITKEPLLQIQKMKPINQANGQILSNFKQIYIVNATDINVAELSQASLMLWLNIPLLIFIILRKNLRGKKSHQLFINILIVHTVSSSIIISSNLTSNVYMRIYTIINNGLLIEMFQSMILLTCERLLAIKYPFKYADITGKHIMIVVGTSWLLVVAFVGLAIKFNVTQNECSIVSTVLILTAGITLTTTNVIIYFIAKKHDTFMKENVQRHNKNTTKAVKMLKASFVCFAVTGSFFLLWAPYLVHNLMLLTSVYKPKIDGEDFTKVVDHIAYLHSIVDPITFIWLSNAAKKEIKKLVTTCTQRQSESPNIVNSQDTRL